MSVLLLADAKRYLRITSVDEDQDAELQETIDSAEAALADEVGPLAPTEKVERVSGGTDTLVLSHVPVVSLTTVVGINPATTVDVDDLTVDEDTGIVRYANGIGVFTSAEYIVTQQAGRDTLPKDLRGGLKRLVKHLWSTDRRDPRTAKDDADKAPSDEWPKSVQRLVTKYQADEQGFA